MEAEDLFASSIILFNINCRQLKLQFKFQIGTDFCGQMEKLLEKIEEMRKQIEALMDENRKLESQIKALEDLNKRQLLQFTDPSNIPDPLRLSQKLLKLKSLEDVKSIHKIRDKVNLTFSRDSLCSFSETAAPEVSFANLENSLNLKVSTEVFSTLNDSIPAETEDTQKEVSDNIEKDGRSEKREAENILKLLELDEDECIECSSILKRSDTQASTFCLQCQQF